MNHYYCEANKCTNALTRKGLAIHHDFVIFDSMPLDICKLFYFITIWLYSLWKSDFTTQKKKKKKKRKKKKEKN